MSNFRTRSFPWADLDAFFSPKIQRTLRKLRDHSESYSFDADEDHLEAWRCSFPVRAFLASHELSTDHDAARHTDWLQIYSEHRLLASELLAIVTEDAAIKFDDRPMMRRLHIMTARVNGNLFDSRGRKETKHDLYLWKEIDDELGLDDSARKLASQHLRTTITPILDEWKPQIEAWKKFDRKS